MNENPYDILGIPKEATSDEIKKAYRKMSLKHHPDKNNNSKESIEMFQKITYAYETLTNPKQDKQPQIFKTNVRFNSNNVDLEEFMTFISEQGIPNFFQNPHIKSRMQKPIPIVKKLTITMEQSYTGCSIPIEIERWVLENNNKVFETETIYVDIPEGTDQNELIIIRNKGNVIDLNTNNLGDIKIYISIENNPKFIRKGLDVLYKKQITLKEALCGFSFDFTHLSGKSFRINNQRGNITSLFSQKIVKDYGFKRKTNNGYISGSLIIEFIVEMPKTLTEEQISALEKIL